MMRVGVIAALAGELKPLVHGWERSAFSRGAMYTRQADGVEMVAVHGGMGREAAAASFMQAAQAGPLAAVVSVGWAGALTSGASTGCAHRVTHVVDASTGERYVTEDEGRTPITIRLVTSKRVAMRDEKARLADAYEADLVDMEAATIARLARVNDIPFYCYKAVSDSIGEALPDMNPYIRSDGRMNMKSFVASVIVQPQYWSALARMGRNSSKGAVALAAAVNALQIELRPQDDRNAG